MGVLVGVMVSVGVGVMVTAGPPQILMLPIVTTTGLAALWTRISTAFVTGDSK